MRNQTCPVECLEAAHVRSYLNRRGAHLSGWIHITLCRNARTLPLAASTRISQIVRKISSARLGVSTESCERGTHFLSVHRSSEMTLTYGVRVAVEHVTSVDHARKAPVVHQRRR